MRRRLFYNVILVAVLAAAPQGVATHSGAADPPGNTSAPPGASDPGGGHTVTLITGDRILVEKDRTGRSRASVVSRAPGTATYTLVPQGESLYVIPDQALPAMAAGTVDKRLFDVAGLVEQGYADDTSDALPLIIESAPGLSSQRIEGAQTERALPSIHASAAEVDKDDTARFWESLSGGTGLRAAGATKVWLDGQVKGSLDRSVAQIGGPAAQARGLDGSGVTVAVLDSGIDTSHPDLAGQVAAEKNFTEEPDTTDHVGHGTHVASTVAGTGAASDGKYAGVAPGARLLNAKVLQLAILGIGIPTGVGRESWIIAGMEWAVDEGADIVNVSLGNSQPDGTDPLSQAVNSLTASSDTLFAVAAGNEGVFGHYTVGSPAAADSALAVGSVDRDEAISFFSSLGPRLIDGAVKPEITAPGQDIVAARATLARVGRPDPDNDKYASMSGTSMATPHVAGAAALLLQQHPQWTSAQLKAALTATAQPNPANTVYEQGGGRVDLDRATRQSLWADAVTLNMGYFQATKDSDRATKQVTYRNDSDAPLTLTLRADAVHQSGDPAQEGTLTVSPATLTVPAGATASAQVSVDMTGRRTGAYSGRIVADSSDGQQIGTPTGWYKQDADLVDITFRALDRHGKPAEAGLILRDPRRPDSIISVGVPEGGSFTLRLLAGDYTILGWIRTKDESGRFDGAATVVVDPEFEAGQPNKEITLDARKGRPLSVDVPRDVDINGMTVGLQVTRPELGEIPLEESIVFAQSPIFGSLHAVPMSVLPFDPPRRGHGNFDHFWSLVEPRARAQVVSPFRRSVPGTLMDLSARIDSTKRLQVVDAGYGRPEDLAGRNLDGKLALLRESADMTATDQAQAVAGAGAAAAMISSALPGLFYGTAEADIPVLSLTRTDGDRLRSMLGSRPVTVELSGKITASYQYDLALRVRDTFPRRLQYSFGHRQLAALNVTYHGARNDTPQRYFSRRFPAFTSVCGYCGFVAREGEDWHGPRTSTEYVSPQVLWTEALLQDALVQWFAQRSYRPGTRDISWAQAPVAPGVPIAQGIASMRVEDQLRISLAGFTDSDPAHWSPAASFFGRSTELTRNGEPFGTCADFATLLECNVDVGPERATYGLTARIPSIIDSNVIPPSTTTWTFVSGHATRQALPLIDLDYTLPVDENNAARARSLTALTVVPRHQPGAAARPVNSVKVQVSYNGGENWQSVPVWQLGRGAFRAFYRHPSLGASDGWVALRVTASDPDGNSVVQEIRRAYSLVS